MIETIIFVSFILFIIALIYKLIFKHNTIDEKSDPLFLKNRDYDRSEGFVGYANTWYVVMASRQLTTNKVMTITLCERELLLYRGSSGTVYAMSAYCPHMGANIAIGGKSVVYEGKDCISCPFHGWLFEGTDGKCVKIPNIEKQDIPSGAQILPWSVVEQDTLIYVWYDSEGRAPSYMPYHLSEGHGLDMKRTLVSKPMTLFNNFKWIAENIIDVEHLPHVHSRVIPLFKTNMSAVFLDDAYDDSRRRKIILYIRVFLLGVFIGESVDHRTFYSPTLNAGLTTITIGCFKTKLLFVVNTVPKTPMKSETTGYIITEGSLFGRLMGCVWVRFPNRFHAQDDPIWSNLRQHKQPALTKADRHIVDFRNWCKQFYT